VQKVSQAVQISARDIQRAEMAVGLGPSKSKDFATSLGPTLTPLAALQDHYRDGRLHLTMTARVNGKEYSRGNAGAMHWTWPQILAHASRDTELRPGDVIGSGTVGTGCILELTPEAVGGWLQPGDGVELEIERLGVLKNPVVERPAA
jgi:fumarylacetoacetate (FAA) hydrolase